MRLRCKNKIFAKKIQEEKPCCKNKIFANSRILFRKQMGLSHQARYITITIPVLKIKRFV